MSGGNFDYAQHKIRDIYEEIQNEINKSGKLNQKMNLDIIRMIGLINIQKN